MSTYKLNLSKTLWPNQVFFRERGSQPKPTSTVIDITDEPRLLVTVTVHPSYSPISQKTGSVPSAPYRAVELLIRNLYVAWIKKWVTL